MFSSRPNVTRWKVLAFLVKRVPLVLWCGVRVRQVYGPYCRVTMRRNWRNRNPYGGTYFAAIMAAAEMASGLMVFDEVIERGKEGYKLAVLITHAEAKFIRPMTGTAEFLCDDGMEIDTAIAKAIQGRWASVETNIRVRDASEHKPIAEVKIKWRIIQHR